MVVKLEIQIHYRVFFLILFFNKYIVWHAVMWRELGCFWLGNYCYYYDYWIWPRGLLWNNWNCAVGQDQWGMEIVSERWRIFRFRIIYYCPELSPDVLRICLHVLCLFSSTPKVEVSLEGSFLSHIVPFLTKIRYISFSTRILL